MPHYHQWRWCCQNNLLDKPARLNIATDPPQKLQQCPNQWRQFMQFIPPLPPVVGGVGTIYWCWAVRTFGIKLRTRYQIRRQVPKNYLTLKRVVLLFTIIWHRPDKSIGLKGCNSLNLNFQFLFSRDGTCLLFVQIYHLSNIRHILNSRLFKLPFSVWRCIMTAIDCSVSYCSCTWPRLSHQRGGFNVWTGVHFLEDCSLWWPHVIPLDKVCSNSSWNWEKRKLTSFIFN